MPFLKEINSLWSSKKKLQFREKLQLLFFYFGMLFEINYSLTATT
jgi:hypothetical protein